MRNIIAILRGITPDDARDIAKVLLDSGISRIEIPLNSPQPFDSIERMMEVAKGHGCIGAGTVLTTEDVARLAEMGAGMVVSPDCNPDVIAATKKAGMLSYPGVFTATECFSAIRAGADGLKLFPAFLLGTKGLAALGAVLPSETPLFAVGGVGPEHFADWKEAGAAGFGMGTQLYKPGDSATDVARKARACVLAYDAIFAS